MAIDEPLTEEQLEQLRSRGYIKVRAFAAEDAAEMEAIIWHKLEKDGVLRDDPLTSPPGASACSRSVLPSLCRSGF